MAAVAAKNGPCLYPDLDNPRLQLDPLFQDEGDDGFLDLRWITFSSIPVGHRFFNLLAFELFTSLL